MTSMAADLAATSAPTTPPRSTFRASCTRASATIPSRQKYAAEDSPGFSSEAVASNTSP